MTYYLHQLRLWWWQMKREGAELERDRAMLMWRVACDDVESGLTLGSRSCIGVRCVT